MRLPGAKHAGSEDCWQRSHWQPDCVQPRHTPIDLNRSYPRLAVTMQEVTRLHTAWKRGLRTDEARRFKELQRENARLKKVVADLSLDNAILKEAA